MATWNADLPTATACFEEDFAGCTAHLRLPIAHRIVTRTTNLLERLFAEERRRTKTIPHTFGERAVLKLIYAALIRASDSWNGVKVTEFETRQLHALREDLDRAHAERVRSLPARSNLNCSTKVSSRNRT